jgi:3'-phosphoadenosine 5'-phosphosulfate sulfotransferase (PAPS reductase)/FAD synthetase
MSNQLETVLSASYGNDSVALIQWAYESGISNAVVTFVDTGWAGEGWMERVERCEDWVRSLGYEAVRITPAVQFEELIRMRKGFPNQRYQWCSGLLKGVPFLEWIDAVDQECKATVLIGKRREESEERKDTPEFIEASDYHGGRRVHHPLYLHDELARDALIHRAGFEVLPHRSKECDPCVNANRGDLRTLAAPDVVKLANLEGDVGKPMFRAKRHGGARGIERVIRWANSQQGRYNDRQDDLFSSPCSSGYCGH